MPAAILDHLERRTIIYLMGAIAIINLLPVTLYLPILPDIADSLSSNLEQFQFTLPLYVITQVVAVPPIALLADLGYRQQSLYWALVLFIAGTLLCLLAGEVILFSAGRMLQAIAAAGLLIIIPVLINEAFENNEAAAILSFVTAIGFIIPMAGPEFSTYISKTLGWHWLFLGLLIYAMALLLICFFLLKKAPPVKRPTKTFYKGCLECWRKIISDRYTLAFLICNTGIAAVCQIYVTNSDFLYLDYYQLGEQAFSYILSCLYLTRMAITIFNGLLLKHTHYQRIVFWSFPALTALTLFTYVLDRYFPFSSPVNLAMPIIIFAVSGFIVTNAVAGVLQNHEAAATQASALLFILYSSIASVINSLLIFFHDGTPRILSLFAVLIIMITWFTYLAIIPRRSR